MCFYFSFAVELNVQMFKIGNRWVRDQEKMVDMVKSHSSNEWASAVLSCQNVALHWYQIKLWPKVVMRLHFLRTYLYLYRLSPRSGWTGFLPSMLLIEDTLGFDWGKGPKSFPEKRPVCRRFSTDADRATLLDFHQSPFSGVAALIPLSARPIRFGWPDQEPKFPTE